MDSLMQGKKIATNKKSKPQDQELEFGNHFSDHMLTAHFENGRWHESKIVAYQNISLAPSALGLQYGQCVFEGMKAFRLDDGRVNIFRMDAHFKRFNESLRRLCIPEIPSDIFFEGLKQLVMMDRDWIPRTQGCSLYIRPFVFASEERFGVKESNEYMFITFSGPVPAYFTKPLALKVEKRFSRACEGGTGFAKCGGNYAGSFLPAKIARDQQFDQVLWTDSHEHRYIEESGLMNVFFFMNNELITPPAGETILSGITRDCILKIAADMLLPVQVRPVSVKELKDAYHNGFLHEVFASGTAATIAPIHRIAIDDEMITLPAYDEDSLAPILKNQLQLCHHAKDKKWTSWNTLI